MDFASMDRAQLTLVGSGFSALLSMHFTIQLLSQHLFFWKNPKEQKAIIMIICMAPLYAIDSFVGLLDIRGSKTFFMFLDSVKECYEAVAIAKFLALMYCYLNISIGKNIVPDEIKGREIHHSFPMTLFQPRTALLDHRTLKLLKHWTWQFVIIRPACSILMITLQILGLYPSWLSWTFTIILNISFSVAMYSLVVFYHVFSKELQPHKPLSKFICIKGIVFFSFWQGLLAGEAMFTLDLSFCFVTTVAGAIDGGRDFAYLQGWEHLHLVVPHAKPFTAILYICVQTWKRDVKVRLTSRVQTLPRTNNKGLLVKILVSWGIIKSHHFWLDVEHLQEAIQNVLICVEMVFFSVMQQYAYHVAPYSGDVEAKLKLKKDD
ncbi:hypothetical protein MTR67_009484 [Solanum verrucosum]|uniref:Uncharacterized protein n=1 Tax=Solanum verrucosum TaxID=315347 RepID=A0AAF0Q9X3_SOLVR|nr:hypothetical protein MTR67_009484 [Solanum verrucosum]